MKAPRRVPEMAEALPRLRGEPEPPRGATPETAPENPAAGASPLELLASPPLPAAPAPTRALPPSPAPVPPETDAHADYLARRHFASLDGLRALGILAVVWHHTVGGPGRLGANLFFLLSGFLVTTILVRERARRGAIDVRRFRTRRARRLYPLYFAVLLAYTALVGLLEPPGPTRSTFFQNLPAFASFTSNLLVDLEGERTIFYFAWSLAAQEQFYLLWPLYLRHLDLRTCALALVSLLATVYLTRAGVFDLALPQGTWPRALVLSVMPALVLGALLALALHVRPAFRCLRSVLGARGAAPLLLAAALWIWRHPAIPEPFMHLVLAGLTAAAVLREDHRLAPLLRHPWVVHVGTVSYGIYLLHMLCHNAVEHALARLGPGPLLDFALTAALAIGLATLSHRSFERRFLPAEKRASGSPGVAAAAASAQARSSR